LEEAAGLLRAVKDAQLQQTRGFYLVKRRDRELTGAAAALWQLLTQAPAPQRQRAKAK
jgi:hypothetical protein